MEAAYDTLLSRPVMGGISEAYKSRTAAFAKDGKEHPRIVTLGGDHTIVRASNRGDSKYDAYIQTLQGPPHLAFSEQSLRTGFRYPL